jgi:hypothetical protein
VGKLKGKTTQKTKENVIHGWIFTILSEVCGVDSVGPE